jgi:hypothetical protein
VDLEALPDMPFPVLKARSHVNERAKAAGDDPRFSVQIREGLPWMSLDRGRDDTMTAPGRSLET